MITFIYLGNTVQNIYNIPYKYMLTGGGFYFYIHVENVSPSEISH